MSGHPADPIQPEPMISITRPRRMDSAVVLDDGEPGEYSSPTPGASDTSGTQSVSQRRQLLPYLTIGDGGQGSPHGISESPICTEEGLYDEAYAKKVEVVGTRADRKARP